MSRLERGYRRLLLAYPRAYRRARGDEIVTTLLEGAPPDRVRPPAGDAWDLIRGGLRQRFAPPHGRGYAVVALVCAAAVAYLALGGAIRLTTASESSKDTLFIAGATLLPPEAPVYGDQERMLTTFGGPTLIDLSYAQRPRSLDDLAVEARARAIADGWLAGPIEARRFTLERDGQQRVVTVTDALPAEPTAGVSVHSRYPWPAPLLPVGIAAVVLGGLAGWLAGAWTLRRFRSRTPAGQLLIALTGAPGLLLVGAVAVSTAAELDVSGLTVFTGTLPEGMGLAALVLTPLLAASLPADDPAAAPRPPTDLVRVGIRVVTAAHLAFAAAIATVLVTFTVRMLATGADRVAMLSGAHDPKDLLPLPVYAAVMVLFYIGIVLSPLLLLVSMPLLGVGRGRVSPVAWRVLLAAAISAVVLPALLFTPYGGDASVWFMD
ncbi:hypothetical protein Ais01nite_29320 [Asanoa ishikariensis]|uniref:Uncharacterized protein n=1 Tax=Asanoa ishikariensis TaxID=137265 RepID=A0A1H3QLN6_9ACTN|nr:hypothetical protein [Asanoa ishikariensis]GIF64897.1 hypothetical protein Ais01nite_29320 [Asanoa ishikariensis]SDZ14306.1 hypothetical protein SAMN05421684_2990 [Asanoa ishikariensis]